MLKHDMTTGSCRSKECNENPAQQGDVLHLHALRSVNWSAAGFAALLVGANEAPSPNTLLIWLVSSDRLISDVAVQRPCYASRCY